MKKILLILIAFTITSTAMAQIKFGVKGGMNADFYGFTSSKTYEQFNIIKGNNSAGYHIGAQLRINTPMSLYVQADALYNHSSTKLIIDDSSEQDNNLKVKNNNIDIPVVVGFKVAFFRFYVGPKFKINLGHNLSKTTGDTNNIDIKFDDSVFGYQFGVGVDLFKKVTVDLNYNGMFSKSVQLFDINGETFNTNVSNRQLWLSVGFLF